MRLYRAKIPVIAKDVIMRLTSDGDIEVESTNREEAEQDFVAIMEEFLRRDHHFRSLVKDRMEDRNTPYDQYGKVRKALAQEMNHPLRDDIYRFLCRQFVENLMISRFIDEVYSDDSDIYKKVMEVLRSHDVDEAAIREEAMDKVKNIREGTVDYEIAIRQAMRDVKNRRGLL